MGPRDEITNGTPRSPVDFSRVPGAVRLAGALCEAGAEAGRLTGPPSRSTPTPPGSSPAPAAPEQAAAAPSAPAAASGRADRNAVVGGPGRARRARRDARRPCGVHQPRRADQELAAEALPRSEQTAPRARRHRLANTHPLPFSLKVPDDRVTTTLNNALYQVSGAPTGADGILADRSELRVSRQRRRSRVEAFPSRSVRLRHRFRRDRRQWRPARCRRRSSGARPSATCRRAEPLHHRARRPHLRERASPASRAERHREAVDVRQRFSIRRRRRPLLHDRRASAGPVEDHVFSR